MFRRHLCNTKHALNYYYNKIDELIENKKSYYHNNKKKIIDLEKKRRNIHKNEMDMLNDMINVLKKTVKKLETTISVS